VRRLIIDESPINPKYYEKMSKLLDALITQRRQEALDYQKYLEKIVALTKKVMHPEAGAYSTLLNTPAKRALYDNLDKNEVLALAVDSAVRSSRQDDWRSNQFKVKKVKLAIQAALEQSLLHGVSASADPTSSPKAEHPAGYEAKSAESIEDLAERILTLVQNQDEY
jgi:type I restriction enzyme R subunit